MPLQLKRRRAKPAKRASLAAAGANKPPLKRKPKARRSGSRKRRAQRSKRTAPRVLASKRTAFPSNDNSTFYRKGFSAGQTDAYVYSIENEPFPNKALNRHWLRQAVSNRWTRAPLKHYVEAAKGYVHGYLKARNLPPHDWLPVPTNRSIAAIVTVMNEEKTIGAILHQLNRLPLDEVYVIVNGSSDRSFQIARSAPRTVVISYPDAVGYDVGRAIGAKLAKSDILLFLDGDIPVRAEQILPFISSIENGLDIALNDINVYLATFDLSDSVTYLKQFLNYALGRANLGANSMTAVPHALSRKAIDSIGVHSLMVPPKAQAVAAINGLKIGIGGSVNVIQRNKLREHNVGHKNPTAGLIVGDHVEAIRLTGEKLGHRFHFIDNQRQREFARR